MAKLYPPIEVRIEEKVERLTECGCWIWMGTTSRNGYGNIMNKKKSEATHRVSWEIHRGKIPIGMCVLHRCDTPSCINPDHLFIGTLRDNTNDMYKKNRADRRGEKHGGSKLKDTDIPKIRSDNRKTKEISDYFGVSTTTILRVKSKELWSHI